MTRIEIQAKNLPPAQGIYDGIYLGGDTFGKFLNEGKHALLSINFNDFSDEVRQALKFSAQGSEEWRTPFVSPDILISFFDNLHIRFFAADTFFITIEKFRKALQYRPSAENASDQMKAMDDLIFSPNHLLTEYSLLIAAIDSASTALTIFKKQNTLVQLVWKEF